MPDNRVSFGKREALEIYDLVRNIPHASNKLKYKLYNYLIGPSKPTKRKLDSDNQPDGPPIKRRKRDLLPEFIPPPPPPSAPVITDFGGLEYVLYMFPDDSAPLALEGDLETNDPTAVKSSDLVWLYLPQRKQRGYHVPPEGFKDPSVLPTWPLGFKVYNNLAHGSLEEQSGGGGGGGGGKAPKKKKAASRCNRGAVSRSVAYLAASLPGSFTIGKGPPTSSIKLEIARQGAELSNIYQFSTKALVDVGETFRSLFIEGKFLSYSPGTSVSFRDLVKRCSWSEINQTVMLAMHAINTCLFYARLEMANQDLEENCRERCLKAHHELYTAQCEAAGDEAICYSAFCSYHSMGERLFPLAVSGSFYLLIIAALTDSLTSLKAVASPNCITTLGDAIRDPTKAQGGLRTLIEDCIIPNVTAYSKMAPFMIPTFCKKPGIDPFINVTDLQAMDHYFEEAGFDTCNLRNFPRNTEAWESFTPVEILPPPDNPPTPQLLDSFSTPIPPSKEEPPPFKTFSVDDVHDYVKNVDVEVTKVKLAVRLSKNPRPPYGQNADKAKRGEWTEEMRRKYGKPENYVKANPENVQALVDDLYEGGKLNPDAKFVYIDTADFPPGVIDLELEGAEGEDSDIPAKISIYTLATQEMKKHWLAKLDAIYGELLTEADTSKLEEIFFNVAHYVFYNKFNTQGEDESATGPVVTERPRNHPLTDLKQMHQNLKRKIGQNNMVPRLSKESVEHVSEYVKLTEGLATFFAFMAAVIERFNPKKYKKLMEGFANCLPGTTTNPFIPHTGCAANVDALTDGHLDLGDLFSKRGSLVFHTDKHGYRWTHGDNGHSSQIMKRRSDGNNPDGSEGSEESASGEEEGEG